MRLLGVSGIVILSLFIRSTTSQLPTWKRSALIYHKDGRSAASWQKNFMRIDASGQFTGQWLFDHAILTTYAVNGVDIMYGGLAGQDFLDLLKQLTNDAAQVEVAVNSLKSRNCTLHNKMLVSIGMPYVDNNNRVVTVEGKFYNLSVPTDRQGLISWYIQKVQAFANTAFSSFKSVQVWGLYYHREDVIDVFDDISAVSYFNQKVHSVELKTVWVPYNTAPHNWDGKLLGFDVLVVQPSYSFGSSIDNGAITADHLYTVGRKAAANSICMEYELRDGGADQLENWIAHQYLAVAQSTGAWLYPQVFFVGDSFFDSMSGQANADTWSAYNDLCNYLGGQTISNFEVRIPFGMNNYDAVSGALVTTFKVPAGYGGLTSVRLDFTDSNGFWKGQLRVIVPGVFTSFSQRMGSDYFYPEHSGVTVPLSNANITEGNSLLIQLTKEVNSTWPTIIQLVGVKYENPFIANPLFEESSSSSNALTPGPNGDSSPTHLQYDLGKLTDGKTGGNWWWGGAVGWYAVPQNWLSVTIDLQRFISGLSKVLVWTHSDELSAVRLPTKMTALVGNGCAPHAKGTLGLGCPATFSSGQVSIAKVDNATDRYTMSLPLYNAYGTHVTVSAVAESWALLDEIQIFDSSNNVVSTGRPYRVTPLPGDQKTGGTGFPDNNRRLTDGAILPSFIWGPGVDGFSLDNKNGSVETIWDSPKSIRCARVWMTQGDYRYGIGNPQNLNVSMQIRDSSKVWQTPVSVIPSASCGPAPCAGLCFPNPTPVTGVRGSFYNLQSWVMITEISVE